MGAVNSTTMKSVNKVVNESITTHTNNVLNNASGSAISVNKWKFVNNGGTVKHCNITSIQNISSDQQINQQIPLVMDF